MGRKIIKVSGIFISSGERYVDIDLDHLAEVICLVSLEVTLFSLFPYLTLWKEVTTHAHN